MKLFDDIKRKEKDFKSFSENFYSYLNRSARNEHKAIRLELDSWFSRFPDNEKKDLRSRFRSSDDNQHRAAFFELYLHELLLKLRCEVVVHPDLPDTSYSPDFLVKPKNGNKFYLEAKLITFESEEETSQKARKNEVYDVLNRHVDSSNFFIGLDLKGAPEKPPPAKKIAHFLNNKLSKIDPTSIQEVMNKKGLEGLPKWEFNFEGWEIEFFPIPKKEDKQGDDSVQPLGLFSHEATFVDHGNQIRQAIFKKAGKYGKIKIPFIIAVNMLEYVDHIDVMNALFGDEVLMVHTDKLSRKPNGLWIGPNGPINTSISGILCFTQLGINTISKIKPSIYKNPWAKNPYKSILDSFPQVTIEDGKVCTSEGNITSLVLGLPFDWPESKK